MRPLAFGMLLIGFAFVPSLAAGEVVADLSSASIAINTGFTGTMLTVFGVIDTPGNVIVAVEGPEARVTVRRKGWHFGLWVPDDSVTFDHVPQFFALATSHPLPPAVTPDELAQHGLMMIQGAEASSASEDPEAFQEALVRLEKAQGLYRLDGGKIQIKSGKLFRADFSLPVNVPIGAYRVHIAILRNGVFVGAHTLPLTINEDGVSAYVQRAAYQHPFYYALFTLVVVMSLGASAGILSLSRKRT